MKLWLLRPIDGDSRWQTQYDMAFGFVVRAETEEEARAFAQDQGGNEVRDRDFKATIPAWTSSDHSTCVELVASGEPGVIIQDFNAG